MASDGDRWRDIEALLEAALALPADEREAFLARQPDTQLGRYVRDILAEEERSDFLDPNGLVRRPIFRDLEERLDDDLQPLRSAGPYELLEEIGRGGMARVYRAQRIEGGFEQTVAIKLIRRQIESTDARERFERERQILANLSHPAIAKLLDGGESAGQPWFALELIDGTPVESYCAEHNLQLDERLRLFVRIVEAVAYAHRNLVVHRDIKSSNVLVTTSGDVKLLDFGIARLVEPETPSMTAPDQQPMTPEFASPEQLLGESVTTASDVYQLGHLLYRLVTEQSPYQSESKTPPYLHRAILTETPVLPSLAAGAPTRPSAAPARVPWASALRGDLDAIVMTAMRKEPERRYTSVGQLLDDLRAYLDGYPVRARPDSLPYRAMKLVTRHRAASTIALIALLTLAAVVVAFGVRLTRERDRAVRESQRSQRIADFLTQTFQAADPSVALGESLSARDLLDRGAERIASDLEDEPTVRASLLETMGVAYREIGAYERAAETLERAVEEFSSLHGEQHADTLRSRKQLGHVYWHQSRFTESEELLSSALETARTELGSDDPLTLEIANHLGLAWWRLGRYDEAEDLFAATFDSMSLTLGSRHITTLAARANLAGSLFTQGRFAEASTHYEPVLEARRELLPPDHSQTLQAVYNLGLAYRQLGRYEEARPLLEEASTRRTRVFGESHRATLGSQSALASLYALSGDHQAALDLHTRVLEARLETLGPDHIDSLASGQNVAGVHYQAGDLRLAISGLRANLVDRQRVLGPDHPGTLGTAKVLAQFLDEAGDSSESEELYETTLTLYEAAHSPQHRVAIEMRRDLGRLRCTRGSPAGLDLVSEALELIREHHPGDALLEGTAMRDRGRCLASQGRYGDAERELLASHSLLSDSGLPVDKDLALVRSALAQVYRDWGRLQDAERWSEPTP